MLSTQSKNTRAGSIINFASLLSFLSAVLTLIAFAIDIALFVYVKHQIKKLPNVDGTGKPGPGEWAFVCSSGAAVRVEEWLFVCLFASPVGIFILWWSHLWRRQAFPSFILHSSS